MADNRLAEAIDVLVREHIARAARKPSHTAYLFLSRSQWEAFNQRVIELTNRPSQSEYQAAREYLQRHVSEGDE